MSATADYATPILYINMGGEMLYVLQQRLQTQKISPDKTIQVLNEVIFALLNPKQLELIWVKGPLMGLGQLRPILERVVLSSIMKLDANSMAKLFDLMIMMVKYQLTTATGPRELILSSLNHLDAIRDMAATDSSLGDLVDACHRRVLDTYGQMMHKQVWQIRTECLHELQHHNVRVSILLRLGMQNQDATFNRLTQRYDEKYQDREQLLENLRLVDVVADEDPSIGQLSLLGDRATLLGKNAYCTSYGLAAPTSSSCRNVLDQQTIPARSNKVLRQELQTLATQLGKEETAPARPFSLQLHLRHEENANRVDESAVNQPVGRPTTDENYDNARQYQLRPDDQYRNTLIDNVNAQFADDNDNATRTDSVDFMNLLDVV
ncbi:protein OSCP1 [Phymastichus coffea]|uniref:protein OSCP1 n=1 Tax=Phymastichus coffea TaxID=108790 RepID=UPI00273C5CDE|nr:protein OSCP1 [Phymastichus coffea]